MSGKSAKFKASSEAMTFCSLPKILGLSQNEPVALIRPVGVFWACEGFLREDMELLPKKRLEKRFAKGP